MRVALAFLALVMLAPPVKAAQVSVSDIALIPVHDGINAVANFSDDGRAATIVQAWRDNGNAHGHYTYLVLLPLKQTEGDSRTGVVAFDDGKNDPLEDTATASPFDGERVLAQTFRLSELS